MEGATKVRKIDSGFGSFIKRTALEHSQSPGLFEDFSPVQVERRQWCSKLPSALRGPVESQEVEQKALGSSEDAEKLSKLFPNTWGQKFVELVPHSNASAWEDHPPLRIGVVLSGGQAPGGHNVIAGLFDYLKQCNANSQLFGFLNGPHGIFTHNYREINDEYMGRFRNQGGFDMICSGRHKIETEDQKNASMQICKKLDLHGLCIIGGDDSNTNAAILAEYFKANRCTTKVVGCPKTIDGDLKNDYVETSFGFDTAVKVYAELTGNLCTDVATSQNRYHFVRLMGRSASNIALECAIQTRANLTFVGEEVQQQNRSLHSLVTEIVQMIVARQEKGKNYGIVLVPEGLIEFIPEVGNLIREINDIVAAGRFDAKKLSEKSAPVFESLPDSIKEQLLLDRDPHGNVQVAKIATEKLLILMTQKELEKLGKADKFMPTSHYFGYEGRCAMPSNFDANYCYALGRTAGALVDNGVTGYMAVVRGLKDDVDHWRPAGCPMTYMMTIERRKGKDVPVIKKYLVELDKPLFTNFVKVREQWKMLDLYRNPGPIQFEGPCADVTNFTIVDPTVEYLLPKAPDDKNGTHFPKTEELMSQLQRERLHAPIEIAECLRNPMATFVGGQRCLVEDQQNLKFVTRSFPLQSGKHKLKTFNLEEVAGRAGEAKALRIGVALCGQQTPGAQNVVQGIYERMQIVGGKGTLFGFKGITGLLDGSHIEVSSEVLRLYANQGGFEMLGRTEETKPLLRTKDGLDRVMATVKKMRLDGLVMIGGQTSLTDATVLAEHFLQNNVETCVVAVPATQENNLRHPLIETCVGFDSTSKCYASLVGNLLTDAASATKYWYFVRLMGQVPSHIVLESALQTHPNFTVISEKYSAEDQTLEAVVQEVADVICSRADKGKNFGTVLVPEGLLTQLPQMRQLLLELDQIVTTTSCETVAELEEQLTSCETSGRKGLLTPWSQALLMSMPPFFRQQLLKKTPSGRVELSEIGTEQLLSELVALELKDRKEKGFYLGSFSAVCHYFGFQGRSTFPSTFDCALGLAHGYLAAVVVESGLTGYFTSVRGLCGTTRSWRMSCAPIVSLMKVMPEREMKMYGRHVPMVPCAEVDLSSKAYTSFKSASEQWEEGDHFCNPGPIQFHSKAAEFYNRTLFEDHNGYLAMLEKLDNDTAYIQNVCSFGVPENVLQTAVLALTALRQILSHQQKTQDVDL